MDRLIAQEPFGRTPDGEEVALFTLACGGLRARIATWGGVVVSLEVPDRQGRPEDVVLGYPDLAGYLADPSYLGALIGRCGNRLAGGRFELDGQAHALACNNGPNHLHGGPWGFHRQRWSARPRQEADRVALELSRISPDGEEGYPGRLAVTVTYALTEGAELRIDYAAATDRPTLCNLTHHSYFNLEGEGSGDVLGHRLTLLAGRFTPIGPGLIPTGQLAPVEGTPMDFRTAHTIGERIEAVDPQLELAGGYDHNWVLDGRGDGLALVARLEAPRSGRVMEVLTTEPGLQFYSGNFLKGLEGKRGHRYARRTGLCLETQHFPDAPHHPGFPSIVLRPGDRYRSSTVYRFGTV